MTDQAIDMPKRPAKWVNVNTREEMHGDSRVLCADISLRGFHIDKAEYNFIRGYKQAWDCNFASETKSNPAAPLNRNTEPTKITDKYDGCSVEFGLGLTENTIEFEDATISKIVLIEQVGGLALMDCLIQTEIEDTDDVARLLDFLNDDSNVGMTIGAKAVPKDKKAQQKLDLSVPSGKEESKGDAAPASTH